MTKVQTKSYHVYLNEKCLFKNLSQEEFDIVWNRIYESYWREELSYTEVVENPTEPHEESSY
jgi:hypothetical protein|tara:strand:+ start:954 stop:1139 length:186 start_codon:yes stop_codon:yes gene_type:complete